MNIFMTGGTGLIGRWTVVYLTQQQHKVKVLARNAQSRKTDFFDWIQQHGGNPKQVELLEGDLAQPGLGLSDEDRKRPLNTDAVYHMGAAFSWGLSVAEARKITVEGSREVIAMASQLPELKQFVHMSGYMLAAPHIWELLGLDKEKQDATEALTDHQIDLLYKKYGAYEATKIESHFVIQRLAKEQNIPLTGILLSSAIGHSQTGEIEQPQGIPMLVKGIWNGEMPAIPGTDKDWIPLVTVDYLAAFITGILNLPETVGKNYVVLDDETPNLAELIELVSRRIGNKPPSRFVSKKLIQTLLNLGLDKLFDSNAETLNFLQPFQFDTQPATQIARKLGLEKPDIHQAILKLVDYLVDTDFGTQPSPDDTNRGRYVRVANTQTFIRGDRTHADTVFLHGMPLNSDSWSPLISQLEGQYMAADIPNVSRSKGQYVSRLDWMNGFLSQQTKAPDIMGHSLGTGFAIDYAIAHPDRVNNLILISPYFLQKPAGVEVRLPFIGQMLRLALNKKRFGKLVMGGLDAQFVESAFSNTRRPGVFPAIMKSLKQVSESSHRNAFLEKLQNLEVPTLIIYGSNDPLIEKLPDNPNLRLQVIEGAGHNPHLSHHEEVIAAINSFKPSKSETFSGTPWATTPCNA